MSYLDKYNDSLCGNNYRIPAGHTRGKFGTHRDDQLLDILAIFASVVCHSDNLSMWNEFADTVKLDLDPHGGKTPRLCFLGQGSVGVGP